MVNFEPFKEDIFDTHLQKYIDECRRKMYENTSVPKDFYMNERPRFSGPSVLALKLFKDKFYGKRDQGT